MRTFTTGATRDQDTTKLDYEGFLSPLVLERFAKYMHKNRTQADGNVRDSDNWQKLFGENHYDVCLKSAWRHFHSWWSAHRGIETKEDIEDSMMALLFNVMAYAHAYFGKEMLQLADEPNMPETPRISEKVLPMHSVRKRKGFIVER